MSRLRSFAENRPVLFSLTATLSFVVLLVAVLALGRALPGERGLEAGGVVGRASVTIFVVFLLSRFGWLARAGFSRLGTFYSWLLVVPPFLYVAIVYSLLFTGRLSLNLQDPLLSGLVAANGFAAGMMEEVVFRGLIFYALLRRWGAQPRGIAKSLIVSSILFSTPHALNIFAGSEILRVLAQLIWAALFGVVFGTLLMAGGSIWPVVALHGLGNAVIHVNRLGVAVELTTRSALLLAIAPIPVLVYGLLLMRRGIRLPAATVE